MAKGWEKMTEDERRRAEKKMKKAWENMTDDEKKKAFLYEMMDQKQKAREQQVRQLQSNDSLSSTSMNGDVLEFLQDKDKARRKDALAAAAKWRQSKRRLVAEKRKLTQQKEKHNAIYKKKASTRGAIYGYTLIPRAGSEQQMKGTWHPPRVSFATLVNSILAKMEIDAVEKHLYKMGYRNADIKPGGKIDQALRKGASKMLKPGAVTNKQNCITFIRTPKTAGMRWYSVE